MGLSNDLREAFPATVPSKLKLENSATQTKSNKLHSEWVAGFSTGGNSTFYCPSKI
jgi:hypothetical protein